MKSISLMFKEDFEKKIVLDLATNNLSKEQIAEFEELKRIYNDKISALSKK